MPATCLILALSGKGFDAEEGRFFVETQSNTDLTGEWAGRTADIRTYFDITDTPAAIYSRAVAVHIATHNADWGAELPVDAPWRWIGAIT